MGGYENFWGQTSWGYAAVGLLAFALGIAVTLLCFRVQELRREEKKAEEQENDGTD